MHQFKTRGHQCNYGFDKDHKYSEKTMFTLHETPGRKTLTTFYSHISILYL